MNRIFITDAAEKRLSVGPRPGWAERTAFTKALGMAALYLLLLTFLSPAATHGAVSGDFKSAKAGPWNSTDSWETYTGTGWAVATEYPGQSPGTYAVTIQSAHEINISANLSTESMGTVTISGMLFLEGNTEFYLNTLRLDVPSGGTIYFGEYANTDTVLSLPTDAKISVTTGGLTYETCNANKYILIGGDKLCSCSGGGAAGYSFADLMAAGGDLCVVTPSLTGTTGFCAGASTVITATPSGASYTYDWSKSTAAGSGTGNTFTATSAGTVSVTVTDANGCTGSATVDVTVNAAPSVSLTGTTGFCAGASTVITATPSDASYTYDWSKSTAAGSGTGNTFTATSAGTVSVTVTDDKGCTGSATLDVTVNAAPSVSLTGTTGFCAGSSTVITATPSGASYTYDWSKSTAGGSGTGNTFTATSAGTVSVTVTDDKGCTGSATLDVTENSIPDAPTASAASNPDKSFTLRVTSSTSGLTFAWFRGGCSGTAAGSGTSINVTPTVTTTYYVKATNASGCESPCGTVTVTVNVARATFDYTLPGGDGLPTDYRMFTVPLYLGTGADMLTQMEMTLDKYHPGFWRVFAFNGGKYSEMGSQQFAALDIVPGMAFWIITLRSDRVRFEGTAAAEGVSYNMSLSPGWHLIGLPWLNTDIDLGNIRVTDGVNEYAITDDPDNTLTQRCVWEYTGGTGYARCTSTLRCGNGYFLNVLAGSDVTLIIPPVNTAALSTLEAAPDDPTLAGGEAEDPPPPPPGAEPMPGITANNMDGSVKAVSGVPVSVSVTLDPGAWAGRDADWWVAAHTPFEAPYNWYSYIHPQGWFPGIHRCVKVPLFQFASPYQVLYMDLPPGRYTFYFAVDGNADGKPDVTWYDSVDVTVE